ncbi:MULTISPECIES: transposase [Stenotrophomonas]|uniref:transposase n=1 Tax=Stenotrophomonas TaxID=40323 RepID=UPI001FD30C62|nr:MULTISPECIES: transposase [Stenotrophomonas]
MLLADGDRVAYLRLLCHHADQQQCRVHAYVLMNNHIHMRVTPDASGGLSRMMQAVNRAYVRRVNDRHGRTGTLWEGRFHSTLVDIDRYLLACQRYIQLNPVRAGMVAHPGDYRWSSYRANAQAGRTHCSYRIRHSSSLLLMWMNDAGAMRSSSSRASLRVIWRRYVERCSRSDDWLGG